MMFSHRLFQRRVFRRLLLTLPALALYHATSQPVVAQAVAPAAATTAPGLAPSPAGGAAAALTNARDAEAQRRRTLSHRRRVQQLEESARNDAMLAANLGPAPAAPALMAPELAAPAANAARRRHHRTHEGHRNTTADGRRAMRPKLPDADTPPLPAATP
jgi:hypothetical protein